MKLWRNKLVLLGVFLSVTGAGTVFLWRVASRVQAPTVPSKNVIKDTPEHESKELAVQLQKKPGHTPILMRMAELELDQGKLDDAAGHLREVLQNEPGNADAHLELGRILYQKNDWNAAIAETQKALAINPKHVDALYNLGAIYANGGDTERARSLWRSAMTADPKSDSGQRARESLSKLPAAPGGKR